MTVTKFAYKREEGQNPYCGFTSFQHFRGEKLYSDIVVRPENRMTETENVECYPIPDDVPQNGREEGYYPDTSIAYIRILWKEFEPQQGQYNYAFVQQILEDARAHDQVVCFRLMAHSTRACDDVPEWLKSLIPCPERPPMMRVKDSPTDPLFLKLFGQAVQKLGEAFDSDPTFAYLDMSLPGAWGEGHKLELFPDEDIRALMDIYVEYFQHTQLIGQLARPEMLRYASRLHPAGWRGDGLGDPFHINDRYPPLIAELSEVWKVAPVSFEAYWWMGEWQRKGWDLDNIIEKTLEWHISAFNGKSIPVPFEWQEKVDAWVAKMGYHLKPATVSHPDEAAPGETLSLELAVDNVGVAPLYNRLPLKVRLTGPVTCTLDTAVDVTRWLPGITEEQLSLPLPADLPTGTYTLSVGIGEESDPMVYWCVDAPRDGRYYAASTLTVK